MIDRGQKKVKVALQFVMSFNNQIADWVARWAQSPCKIGLCVGHSVKSLTVADGPAK